MLLAAATLMLAYVLGSFPTGVVLGTLFADVDVRQGGSGNIGATNVNRLLGRRLGALTLAADAAKGLVPVLVAGAISPLWWLPGAAGLMAFAGHCWSGFLGFKGGKGVATAAGVMLALAPLATLIAAVLWVVVVLVRHKSSLGALVAAATLPLLAAALYDGVTWVAVALAVGIAIRHKDNILRLRSGTELGTRAT